MALLSIKIMSYLVIRLRYERTQQRTISRLRKNFFHANSFIIFIWRMINECEWKGLVSSHLQSKLTWLKEQIRLGKRSLGNHQRVTLAGQQPNYYVRETAAHSPKPLIRNAGMIKAVISLYECLHNCKSVHYKLQLPSHFSTPFLIYASPVCIYSQNSLSLTEITSKSATPGWVISQINNITNWLELMNKYWWRENEKKWYEMLY
jgi:hypothetical protein